jgi:hypothetical protein
MSSWETRMSAHVREPRRADRLWAEDYLSTPKMAWAPKGTDPRVTGVVLHYSPEEMTTKAFRRALESRVTAMWILDPVTAAMEIRQRLPWDRAAMVLEAPLLEVGERLVSDLRDHLTGLSIAWERDQEEPGTKLLPVVKAVGFLEWISLVLPSEPDLPAEDDIDPGEAWENAIKGKGGGTGASSSGGSGKSS